MDYDEYRKYFIEGYRACLGGDGQEDNPYDAGTEEFDGWSEGFDSGIPDLRRAEEEAEEEEYGEEAESS